MHEHLRAWRHARGMTLQEVAERLMVRYPTVQRWETGVHPIPPTKFQELAVLYGVTPAELLFTPSDAEAAKRLHRAVEIVARLSDSAAEQWLQIGASLAAAND